MDAAKQQQLRDIIQHIELLRSKHVADPDMDIRKLQTAVCDLYQLTAVALELIVEGKE